jgi:hypothetical protein
VLASLTQCNLIATLPKCVAQKIAKGFVLQTQEAPLEIQSFDINVVIHAGNPKNPMHGWFIVQLKNIMKTISCSAGGVRAEHAIQRDATI